MKLYMKYLKEYKKNSITLFLCFSLTLALMVSLIILLHTNHKITALQNMLTHTPADVRITQLSEEQVTILKDSEEISKLAVLEQPQYMICDENRIYFQRGDKYGITLTCKLEKGRMPSAENEIVLEKWVLLNLGKIPTLGQKIELMSEDTGSKKEYEVVGILSDITRNKQVGLMTMYSCFQEEYSGNYIAYINYKDKWDFDKAKEITASQIDVSLKVIQDSPGRENMKELVYIDAVIIMLSLLLFVVIFSGVFRIVTIARQGQYGILRAIGASKHNISSIFNAETFIIGLLSGLFGVVFSYLIIPIINLVLHHFTGDIPLSAMLDPKMALFLIILSIVLTLIGGLIPAKSASKKDPVEALRSE